MTIIKCKTCEKIFETDFDEDVFGCEDFFELNLCDDCQEDDDDE